jgi:LPXTG-motif cell wall-anchored protein
MPKTGEIKTGFWLGLGVALAFLALGFLQAMTLKAVSSRNA